MVSIMKRQRTDSATGATEIFQGAASTIDPPLNIDLGEGVHPYWDRLTKAKAARAWKEQDLFLLVELARNLYRTENLSREILNEAEIIQTPTGFKANPKSGLIDQLVKRARLIMIMLQIHPEATQGKARAQVKQNQAHEEALSSVDDSGLDDLIAKPTPH